MNRQSHQFSISKPKNSNSTNSLTFLSFRERGLRRKTLCSSDVFAVKTKQIRLTNRLTLNETQMPATKAGFVKNSGERGYLINVCQDVPGNRRVSGTLHLVRINFRPNTSKEEFPSLVSKLEYIEERSSPYSIVDACFYKMRGYGLKLFAYLTDFTSGNSRSSIMFTVNGVYEMDICYSVNSKVISCAFCPARERFIVGADVDKIYLYEELHFVHILRVHNTPTALEFDKTGNLIYMGDIDSGLYLYDLRNQRIQMDSTFMIYPGSVYGIKLLSDENTVVLTEGDKLLKVDLRTRKCLLNYPGSEKLNMKVPFSVDEDVDMLCSTGLDNKTKLWSLTSGQPLCTIEPSCHSYVQSCIMSNDNQWGVALFQENNMHIFEPP